MTFAKFSARVDDDREYERGVMRWLAKNPPPPQWDGTLREWAYTEMPVGIFTGRPGCWL